MNKKDILIEKANQLERLYCDEKLTTREIGNLFNMSKHPVLDALHELDIPLRHTRSKADKPTCEQLRQWVTEDHLTLAKMAEIVGAHYTGVRYWIDECGIPWDGSQWGQRNEQRSFEEPTKKELEQWYWGDGLGLRQIANRLGVGRQLITDRFDEYGIKMRPSGWQHKRFRCQDGHIVKSTYELRVDNWLFDHGLLHTYEYPLTELGGTSSADFKVGEAYIEVWGVMDSRRYKKRRQEKIAWYELSSLMLISINYWDFSAQKNDLWKRKLQKAFTLQFSQ